MFKPNHTQVRVFSPCSSRVLTLRSQLTEALVWRGQRQRWVFLGLDCQKGLQDRKSPGLSDRAGQQGALGDLVVCSLPFLTPPHPACRSTWILFVLSLLHSIPHPSRLKDAVHISPSPLGSTALFRSPYLWIIITVPQPTSGSRRRNAFLHLQQIATLSSKTKSEAIHLLDPHLSHFPHDV